MMNTFFYLFVADYAALSETSDYMASEDNMVGTVRMTSLNFRHQLFHMQVTFPQVSARNLVVTFFLDKGTLLHLWQFSVKFFVGEWDEKQK